MKSLTLLLSVLISISLLACSSGGVENTRLAITDLSTSALNVAPGGSATLTVEIFASEPENVTISWSSPAGTFNTDKGVQVQWTAPQEEGQYTIECLVTDSKSSATGKVTITVAQ